MFLSFDCVASVLIFAREFDAFPQGDSLGASILDDRIVSTKSARRLVDAITSTSDLQTAVSAWCSSSASASETYGDIPGWDISGVTSLRNLFNGFMTHTQFSLHTAVFLRNPLMPTL